MTIRSEIESRLLAWAAAQNPPIPVALENVSFTKPGAGKSYLQVFFLNSATVNTDVSATGERETGIVQINCCVPQGTGAGAGDNLAESIKSLFPVLPKTGTVSIERPAQTSAAIMRDDGYRVIPVSISYRVER